MILIRIIMVPSTAQQCSCPVYLGKVRLCLLDFTYTVLIQGAAEKSGPLNVFAVFSATVWDFNMKFYIFI